MKPRPGWTAPRAAWYGAAARAPGEAGTAGRPLHRGRAALRLL